MDVINIIKDAGPNISVTLTLKDLKQFAKELMEEVRVEVQAHADAEQTFTAKDIKEKCSISQATLWRWAKKELVHPIKVGGRVVYHKGEIINLIKKGSK